MRECPCHGCTERVPDPKCHGTCERYKEWAEELKATKNWLNGKKPHMTEHTRKAYIRKLQYKARYGGRKRRDD